MSGGIGGIAYRIFQGNSLSATIHALVPSASGYQVQGRATLQYDDGTLDYLYFPLTTVGGSGYLAGATTIASTQAAQKTGWVVNLWIGYQGTAPPQSSVHGTVYIAQGGQNLDTIAEGFIGFDQHIMLGVQNDVGNWACWAFYGNVASDATVGTHVSTLTIVPGTGYEMELVSGFILASGSAGLVQNAKITDASGNVLSYLLQATTAGNYTFPQAYSNQQQGSAPPYRISGAMQLILTSTTSTVSQTQYFGVICRIRRGIPVATLADNTGTPTLTVTTNVVY